MPPLNARGISVTYGPDARDLVQIREGTSFAVPAGRIFVLTALGQNYMNGVGQAWITVNGTPEASTIIQSCGGTESHSIVSLPLGLSVQAGSTIAVLGGFSTPDDARAWGNLAPRDP